MNDMQKSEMFEISKDEINALPPYLRSSRLRRMHLDGATIGQIARHMGISSSRVHMIIKQAERREQWEKRSKNIIKNAGFVKTVQQFMDLRLEAFDFSTRTRHALQNEGFVTVGDVMTADEKYLKSIPNFGRKSQRELRFVLDEAMEELRLQPHVFEPVVLNLDVKQRQEINRIVDDLRKVMTVGWSSEAYLRDAIISLQRMAR